MTDETRTQVCHSNLNVKRTEQSGFRDRRVFHDKEI